MTARGTVASFVRPRSPHACLVRVRRPRRPVTHTHTVKGFHHAGRGPSASSYRMCRSCESRAPTANTCTPQPSGAF
eukprot:5108532-Prymnesium_polylepis.1